MKNQNHIIHKISAELTLPAALQEKSDDDRFKESVKNTVHNLETALDEYFAGVYYRTDTVSVEINLTDEQFSEFTKLLEQTLIKKIQKLGQTAENKKGEPGTKRLIEKVEPSKQTKLNKIELEEHRRQLFIHFLQTGRFPWWAENDSLDKLGTWLNELPADDWLVLIKPLAERETEGLERLVNQFSDSLVVNLIQKSSANSAVTDNIFALLKELGAFAKTKKLARSKQQQLTTRLYKIALSGILKKEDLQSLLGRLIAKTISSTGGDETEKEWKIRLLQSNEPFKDSWLEVTESLASGQLPEVKDIEQKKGSKEQDEEELVKDEGLTVTNAGVVLLHPFIPHLFENLGLVEENAFVSDNARERAVCLMHYLTVGDNEFPEPELVLPKFLCNWPSSQAVNRFMPINDYEKEECDHLLESVIDHWEALKNTSVEGLRQNFLQREGLLREEEFGWTLYVEKKTHDILLDKLPWNLSVVKLPWVEKMLTIKWE